MLHCKLTGVKPAFSGAGIPTLEKSHNKRYGKDPAYKEYKATTNLLIPGPKAKKHS